MCTTWVQIKLGSSVLVTTTVAMGNVSFTCVGNVHATNGCWPFLRADSSLTGLCLSLGYTSRLFLMPFNEINASIFDYNSSPKIRTTDPIALVIVE